MSKTEEKRQAIARLRELLHTQSHTEHDLYRLSIETLKTIIERVGHVQTRVSNNSQEGTQAASA